MSTLAWELVWPLASLAVRIQSADCFFLLPAASRLAELQPARVAARVLGQASPFQEQLEAAGLREFVPIHSPNGAGGNSISQAKTFSFSRTFVSNDRRSSLLRVIRKRIVC